MKTITLTLGSPAVFCALFTMIGGPPLAFTQDIENTLASWRAATTFHDRLELEREIFKHRFDLDFPASDVFFDVRNAWEHSLQKGLLESNDTRLEQEWWFRGFMRGRLGVSVPEEWYESLFAEKTLRDSDPKKECASTNSNTTIPR